MTLTFKKRISFYSRVDWQGDRRQGSNLSPQSRVQGRFKGFQHQMFLDSGPLDSGKGSGAQVLVISWFYDSVGGAVKGLQVLTS